jgi:hypothetical protein
MLLEMVDKMKVSRMCLARIIENIGGRLRMKYENSDGFDDFWCHEKSDLIHPIGWSSTVGHDIDATDGYKKVSAIKYKTNSYEANECTRSMFKGINDQKFRPFRVNMKLEAIDPLNLSAICVATVSKVLKDNYLMVRIDGCKGEENSDSFCYHCTSASIFPSGFCLKNKLPLQPPYGNE